MGDGRWYLAGVTSFGSGCAKAGFPDVFARTTAYLPWIAKVMEQFQDQMEQEDESDNDSNNGNIPR